MHRVNIKPLSVNNAWQGQRYKTPQHRRFCKELSLLLPPNVVVPSGRLKISFIFGLSSKNADGDNCLKNAQDIICAKYGFDDKRIYKWSIEKVLVPKGSEFIEFEIAELERKAA